jgi:hypothetical protein
MVSSAPRPPTADGYHATAVSEPLDGDDDAIVLNGEALPWPGKLQIHNTENSKQIFPEEELRGLIPNIHIHVSVSDRSAYSAAVKCVDRSFWEYINRSQTHECGNWD